MDTATESRSDDEAHEIDVEVVLAERSRQSLIALRVPAGTTAGQAVAQSCVLDAFAHLRRDALDLGIFGRRVPDDHVLSAGDRVEIYRPLTLDPKEARKLRAAR
ncbi:MAG: RnfH family protein [Gammaproteobacteria bacterium]